MTRVFRCQQGLQLIVLSRFIRLANTRELPHHYTYPKMYPLSAKDDPLLEDIRKPTEPPDPDPCSKVDKKYQPFPTYDPRRYQKNKYYPFYSVLLIEWKNGVTSRLGSGQVHVDAFHHANPVEQAVSLG